MNARGQIAFDATLAGKHYRMDFRTDLSAGLWAVLEASVLGTGAEVTVTDTNGTAVDQRFYRAVRLD